MKRVIPSLLLLATFAALTGCASSSSSPPKAESAVYFNQPMDKVQTAAINAATVLGFEIKKQQPDYIEGVRPRKLGLAVGSGGEKVEVWLTTSGDGKIGVKVRTGKTLLGYAGQRNWDDEMLAEMRKELGG